MSANGASKISHKIGAGNYIGKRYNMIVPSGAMTDSAEFRALSEFRYQIRIFLNGSEEAARKAGLEPQQYHAHAGAARTAAGAHEASIQELAERMQLRHHSVVELVDRLEKRQTVAAGALQGRPPASDPTFDSARGTNSNETGQAAHSELRTSAPALVRA